MGYHVYEGVALRDDAKPRQVRDLGDKKFLMLRNHGLLRRLARQSPGYDRQPLGDGYKPPLLAKSGRFWPGCKPQHHKAAC